MAHAMSSTMSATPLIQVATFASWLVLGPRCGENRRGERARLGELDRRLARLVRRLAGVAALERVVEVGVCASRCSRRACASRSSATRSSGTSSTRSRPSMLKFCVLAYGADRDVRDRRLVGPEPRESRGLDADDRVHERADAHGRAERVLSSAERGLPIAVGDARSPAFPTGGVSSAAVKVLPITGGASKKSKKLARHDADPHLPGVAPRAHREVAPGGSARSARTTCVHFARSR